MPNFLGDALQVFFLLPKNGPWPPVPSEGLEVRKVEGGYEVLEAPFFVANISKGDVVAAEPEKSEGVEVLWAQERVRWGGRQTVRVNPRADADLPVTCAEVIETFRTLGVAGEELGEYSLVALDIAPDADSAGLHAVLVTGRDAGRWWFEEACVGASWPG